VGQENLFKKKKTGKGMGIGIDEKKFLHVESERCRQANVRSRKGLD